MSLFSKASHTSSTQSCHPWTWIRDEGPQPDSVPNWLKMMALICHVTHATLPGPLATPKFYSKWSFQICSQSENGNLQTLESFFYQTACLLKSEVFLLQISTEPRCHRQLCRRLITNWLHLTIAIATWNSWLPPCHLNLLWTTSHLRFSSTAHFTCHLQLLAEDVFISRATAPSTCQSFHQILHWIEIY